MIKIDNISKVFKIKERKKTNTKIALQDISANIEKGDTVGLIGKNGSGKSTLLKIISCLYKPTQGSIFINDLDISKNSNQTKKELGILFGGDAGLYNRLTAYENIEYFGQLNGMKKNDIDTNIKQYMKFFDLEDYINRRVDNFSRGMKQKTLFLRSVIHNPSLIILDEPSTGLDVQAINEVSQFIKFNQENKKTIIISSHNMNEIETLCNKVLILKDSKQVFFGDIKDVIPIKGDFTKLYELMGVVL